MNGFVIDLHTVFSPSDVYLWDLQLLFVTLAICHKSLRSILSPCDVYLWDPSPSDVYLWDL